MTSSPTIAVAIIAKNEEAEIAECLESALWADEIIVVDSMSTDATAQICQRYGARVYQHAFLSFPQQRNAALELAKGDWALFIDADERITPELAREARETVTEAGEGVAGFWIPRQNYILGKWIRHGGWYPDYQMRLIRRGRARYDETRLVHEVVILDGESGYLEHDLIHHNYRSLSELFTRQGFYADFQAATLHHQGVRPKLRSYIGQPPREFLHRYVALAGWRDGGHGLLLAVVMAYYALLVQLKLGKVYGVQQPNANH